jgi:hypothetical protein
MKSIATMTLILNLALAAGAQQVPVRMTFSGTGGASSIDLKFPGANTAEENVAGSGIFGSFTLRDVRAASTVPQASNTCSAVFLPSTVGAAQIRFQDGSLLKLTLVQGGDCIDFVHPVGHCTLIFNITGGTGRFKNASGMLTYTETALPLLADGNGIPVYFSETGDITGAISGVSAGDDSQGNQQ